MKRSPEGYAVILTRNTEYTGYRARTTWEATQVAKGAFGGVLAAVFSNPGMSLKGC
jgi:hypothetical protein